MSISRTEASFAILREASASARLSVTGAEPMRFTENDIWRLPNGVVARIARVGQEDAATREVLVTWWLAENGLPAVTPLPIEQPLQAAGRPVTFWEELPAHRPGTATEHVPPIASIGEGVQPVPQRLVEPRSSGGSEHEPSLQTIQPVASPSTLRSPRRASRRSLRVWHAALPTRHPRASRTRAQQRPGRGARLEGRRLVGPCLPRARSLDRLRCRSGPPVHRPR